MHHGRNSHIYELPVGFHVVITIEMAYCIFLKLFSVSRSY